MTKDELEETLGNAILDAGSGHVAVVVENVLAALRDAGLAIVPKEPSEAVQVAGSDAEQEPRLPPWNGTDVRPVTAHIYRAMLSAGDLLGERGS